MRNLFFLARQSLAGPARHPRMAVVIGRLLGIAFLICFGTGLYSHFIQDPLPWMWFPNQPARLYQITQGLHVITGIACIPLLLGKLWTIFPLLFRFPPVPSFYALLERASITIFVSSSLLQLFTGLWNTYQWYIFPFAFRQVHYALSYIIIASLIVHIGVKLPIIKRWFFKKSSFEQKTGAYLPVLPGEGELGQPRVQANGLTGWLQRQLDDPRPPSEGTSRRTVVGTIGAAVVALFLTTGGQSIPVLRPLSVFAPRNGKGKQDLPVNKTAKEARVIPLATASDWTFEVRNGRAGFKFTLDDLRALPQYTVTLPIACVEGWSRSAVWTGVRFRDLASLVDAMDKDFKVQSLQRGAYATTFLENNFVLDPSTLIALRLNGEELDLDHGYPARLIAPARPGVLQTKWLSYVEAQ